MMLEAQSKFRPRAVTLARKLEASRALLLLAFCALYTAAAYVLSRRKFMWNDELFTYYIAKLPVLADVWNALMSGGEQLPPFFYIATRASLAIFGDGKHAFRLPEMIGFAVMCLCLFVYAARRTSNLAGLSAALFPLVTFAFFYAAEARPYGLVLGFSALSLLCWQSATLDYRRAAALFGLALSLAGALSSHYYGLLVIFPLALGETVRTVSRKRLDKSVWAAFAVSITPLLLHLPLIGRARGYSAAFLVAADVDEHPELFFNLLYMAVLPLFCLVLIAWLYRVFADRFELDGEVRTPAVGSVPAHEVAAAAGYLCLPLIAVFLAKTVTGAFTDRYAIAAVIGLSLLFAFAAARLLENNALALSMLLVCLTGWFALLVYNETWKASLSQTEPENKIRLVARQEERYLPIVAADPYTFLELRHYAPPDIGERVIYLADPTISQQRLKHNSLERGMVDLIKPWFRQPVADYKSYIAAERRFLLCGDPNFFSWIVPQLREDGRKLELKDFEGKIHVYLVTADEKDDDKQP